MKNRIKQIRNLENSKRNTISEQIKEENEKYDSFKKGILVKYSF